MASPLSRRNLLLAAPALMAASAAPSMLLAQAVDGLVPEKPSPRNNFSSFRLLDWQDHFENTKNGAILCDISSRALHFWSEDQSVYRLYPTSVPISEELTRRGRTDVIQKVVNPPWRPTPSMRERFPDWPEVVPGGDPKNPLGIRALYLGWQAYRIHGTHDTRKIGRQSSDGCIGLYNEHILELFGFAKVGTQVLLI